MVDGRRFADLAFRVFFTGLLYMLVASAVLHSFMDHEGFLCGEGDLSIESFVDGTGRRPFVHRIGAHLSVRAVASMVPPDWVESGAHWLTEESPLLRYWQRGTGTVRESLYLHVGYGLVFGWLLALLMALRRLTAVAFPNAPPLFVDGAPLVALLFLPQTFLLGGYLYDVPELALLVAAIAALWRRRLGWFAVWFALGVLHKETSLLWLVIAAGVLREDLEPRRLVLYLGGLGSLGALGVGSIFWAYAGNPGQGLELHLLDNLGFWLWPPAYLALMDSYAPLILVPRGGHVLQLFLVGFIVARGWPLASRETRWVFGSMAALMVPLFLGFGFYDEIRALGPVFPGLYLLGCHAIPAVWSAHASSS